MRTKENDIDLEENKSAYVKKVGRQMKHADKRVKELIKLASERKAQENSAVENDLSALQQKLNELHKKLDQLKSESEGLWPEEARNVSSTYRELEGLVERVDSRIKPK